MIKKPTISICIPTYNQPERFKKTLNSIVEQINEKVEVVIRDDSSDKKTENIVKEFISKYRIKYYRGEKEGLDVAVVDLIKKAEGEFIWWLGDDVLLPGSIEKLLGVIKNNNSPSFIFLNSEEERTGFKTIRKEKDFIFSSSNEVLEELADLLGFISATVFKKDKAEKRLDLAEKHVGTAFVNLYIILSVLKKSKKNYLIGRPMFLSESKDPVKPRWYNAFQVFAINLPGIVMEFERDFNKKFLRKMIFKNLKSVLKTILVHRAKGYKTDFTSISGGDIWKMVKVYWSYPVFWVFLPALLFPKKLTINLYNFYKKFFKETKRRF